MIAGPSPGEHKLLLGDALVGDDLSGADVTQPRYAFFGRRQSLDPGNPLDVGVVVCEATGDLAGEGDLPAQLGRTRLREFERKLVPDAAGFRGVEWQ